MKVKSFLKLTLLSLVFLFLPFNHKSNVLASVCGDPPKDKWVAVGNCANFVCNLDCCSGGALKFNYCLSKIYSCGRNEEGDSYCTEEVTQTWIGDCGQYNTWGEQNFCGTCKPPKRKLPSPFPTKFVERPLSLNKPVPTINPLNYLSSFVKKYFFK